MKTPTTRTFPLDRLDIADSNARKTPASAEADRELKASILAHGLRQNLNVQIKKEKGGERGLVVAGGRRLKALQQLAEEKCIPADFGVPCTVVAAKDASEVSLVENIVRAAMHPLDEYEAFVALADKGSSIDQIATRFGATPRQVEQRLRLGRVAAELREAYRAEELSLQDLMAFTVTDDQARQLAIWPTVQSEARYGRNGLQHLIRRLLRDEAVPADSQLGRVVRLEDYEAAGGTVSRDLFAAQDVVHYEDRGLVEKLVLQALEATAAPLRETWKWVDVALEHDDYQAGGWNIEPDVDLISEEDLAALNKAEARLDALENMEEDEWTEELGEEMDDLIVEIRERQAQRTNGLTFSLDAMQRAGCIVTIGHNGIKIVAGVMNEDDVAAARAERAAAEGDANSTDPNDRSTVSSHTRGTGATTEPKPAHSFNLDQDLLAHRVQITAAHLAGAPDAAFDLVLWTMVSQVLHLGYRRRPIDLAMSKTQAPSSLKDLGETPAKAMMDAHHDALPKDFLNLDEDEGFAALCTLPHDDKMALLAYCAAACLTAQLGMSGGPLEVIGRRIGIDVASFWRPTAENYWGRVRKDVIVEVASDVVDAEWAHLRRGEKKGVAAKTMEALFSAGQAIGLKTEVLARAKTWLPKGMAFDGVEAGAVEGPGDEGTSSDASAEAEDNVVVPAFLTRAA